MLVSEYIDKHRDAVQKLLADKVVRVLGPEGNISYMGKLGRLGGTMAEVTNLKDGRIKVEDMSVLQFVFAPMDPALGLTGD